MKPRTAFLFLLVLALGLPVSAPAQGKNGEYVAGLGR